MRVSLGKWEPKYIQLGLCGASGGTFLIANLTGTAQMHEKDETQMSHTSICLSHVVIASITVPVTCHLWLMYLCYEKFY